MTTGVTGTLPIANGGTNSTAIATAGGVGYGTGTAHAYTTAGTSGYALLSGGAGAPTWGAVASAITVTPVSTNATFYPVFSSTSSGTFSLADINTSYTYNPSVGTLTAPSLRASNGIIMNSNTIALSVSIPVGDNAVSTGPVTINSGVVITVPTDSRWVVL